jgi:FkbM family methyltransferase
MLYELAKLVRSLTRRMGVDLIPFPSRGSLAFVLRHCDINCVLDVGANIGQTGSLLRDLRFRGRIISFEPLSHAFAELSQRAKRDSSWSCHHCALGNADGEADIHVSDFSVYSSLLPITEFAVNTDAVARQSRVEHVKVRSLDSLWPELDLEGRRILLKVDTQGFERNVLEGAAASLKKIRAVQLEMSVHGLYKGQPTYIEMLHYMTSRGFVIAGLNPGWNHPKTGEMLEFDALFLFPDASAAAP